MIVSPLLFISQSRTSDGHVYEQSRTPLKKKMINLLHEKFADSISCHEDAEKGTLHGYVVKPRF